VKDDILDRIRVARELNKENNFKDLAYIGANPMLPKSIDPNGRVNELLLKGLKQINLIPVEFKIALDNLSKSKEALGEKSGPEDYLIEYYFDKTKNHSPGPVELFSRVCEKYKLPPKGGVKLFINDESVSQETFTNDFGENVMMTKLNSFSNTWVNSLLQSSFSVGGVNSDVSQFVDESAATATNAMKDIINGFVSRDAGNIVGSLGSIFSELIMGRKISLPSIWNKSDYQTSFSLSVKLLSPYGSPECIKEHIIKPLLYLLILASPRTFDGLTHWKPNYVYVNAFGVTNINLAYIDNISIRRGGHDVSYNVYKQPLMIDVQVSFKSALPGFAVLDSHSKLLPRCTFDEASHDVYTGISKLSGPGMVTLDNILMSLRPYGYKNKTEPDADLLKDLGALQTGFDRRKIGDRNLAEYAGNKIGDVVNKISNGELDAVEDFFRNAGEAVSEEVVDRMSSIEQLEREVRDLNNLLNSGTLSDAEKAVQLGMLEEKRELLKTVNKFIRWWDGFGK
jgi:hypothetical protein